MNGGIKIDERAESTVKGLFAAGEVAAGPHGADRIGGCMMTATQVFGMRAGKFAALRAKLLKSAFPLVAVPEFLNDSNFNSKGHPLNSDLLYFFNELKTAFSEELTVLRDRKGIECCISKIQELNHFVDKTDKIDPAFYYNMKNSLSAMSLICQAALGRKECCGPHYRSDFPLFTPDG